MVPESERFLPAEEVASNAQCLLDHMTVVRRVLRRRGYSAHAIERAVTAMELAAMPYITGRTPCFIKKRRAWLFKVAFRAAGRAAKGEPPCHAVEPAILAATAKAHNENEDAPFDICGALSQLTELQSEAVERCILGGQSVREAAKRMGIAAGTLCNHLRKGKDRLKVILARYEPKPRAA